MIATASRDNRFLVCAAIVIVSGLVSPVLLNTIVSYSTPGGTFLEKFHPATYLAGFSFLVICFGLLGTDALQRSEKLILASFVGLAAYPALAGKFAYAAVVVDIFVAPLLFVLIARRLSERRLISLFNLFVMVASINMPIVLGEFIAKQGILPLEQESLFFRPAGLFGHPIASGIASCIAMLGSRYTMKSVAGRHLVMLILLAEVALCGVRAALLVASVIFLTDLAFPWKSRRNAATYLFDAGIVALLAAVFAYFARLGVFHRIAYHGWWDESAASRFQIFNMFDFMTEDEFWFGTTRERALYYANELNNSRIESSFVVATYQCGIVFAVGLFVALLIYFRKPLLGSFLFATLLLAVSLTTLYFGVKNTVTLPLFLLAEIIVRVRPYPAKPAAITE
ncbi:MAG: hypothetical protein ACT4SY_15465 [Hyphomicrobiales bacterium]